MEGAPNGSHKNSQSHSRYNAHSLSVTEAHIQYIMKTMRLRSSLYATVAYIILRLDPTSSAQLRPRGLAATNTQAAEPDSAWSESSTEMSLATTTSMNFMEVNDKGAKDGAHGLFAKAGRITKGGNIFPASEGPCADFCLEALSNESNDCPTAPVTQKFTNVETAIGEFCEGSGECGTTSKLDNCNRNDIYRRIECESGRSGKSSKASGNPGLPISNFSLLGFRMKCE